MILKASAAIVALSLARLSRQGRMEINHRQTGR